MTRGFVLSPLARQDLLAIWDHIALDNVYHHETKPLEIVRVLHGGRDIAGLL